MKRKLIIVIFLVLVLVLSSCSKTFDGYSYSLEDLRQSEKCYNSYDYLFTIEQNCMIVDFLINGDLLHIIKIDCEERFSNVLYKVKSSSSYLVSESLTLSKLGEGDYWVRTGNYLVQVEWVIVSEEFNDSYQKYEGFNFIYNDIECVLYYRIVE